MVGFGAPDDSTSAVESPREARRRELEARVYGGEAPSPADVSELRALVSGAAKPAIDADSPRHRSADRVAGGSGSDAGSQDPQTGRFAADAGESRRRRFRGDAPYERDPADRALRERPGRAWLAGGVVAVVLAALIGAGATTSILGVRSEAGSASTPTTAAVAKAAPASVPAAAPSILASPAPSKGLDPAAEAEALGAQYFTQAQVTGDEPPVVLPGIVGASTRRVFADWGQVPGEPSVWVARGRDRSFCVIVAIDASHAGSSCTPLADAAAAGVRVSVLTPKGGTIEVTWNLGAGLLELSPFPAGASVISSGALPPTP